MTREEAIKFYADEILLLELAPTINGDNGSSMKEEWKRQADIHRLAISALREQEEQKVILIQQYIKVPEKPQWISVEDKLPEQGELVMCMTQPRTFQVLQWNESVGGWDCGFATFKKEYITHWMPLPEPPKEEV